jgi:hypothetical protein
MRDGQNASCAPHGAENRAPATPECSRPIATVLETIVFRRAGRRRKAVTPRILAIRQILGATAG